MENKIIVYSKKDCTGCRLTKRFLTKKDILFEDRSITNNTQHLTEVEQLGYRTVPVVVFTDKSSWAFQGQPSLAQLEEKLKDRNLL